MSPCRWCPLDHGDARVRHRICKVCGDRWIEEVRRGAPRRLCRKPLCVAIDQWWRKFGRWPPRDWFERYAKRKGLIIPQPIKLRKHLEKMVAGPARVLLPGMHAPGAEAVDAQTKAQGGG